MPLGFCIYHLAVDVEDALQTYAKIADHLGLSNERVQVHAEHGPSTRMALERLTSVNSLFSGIARFSIGVYSGDPIEAAHFNAAPYICYVQGENLGTMTIFSHHGADLRNFAERYLGGVPAKYGFGLDWNRPGSFFNYAQGFDDLLACGGDLHGTSDAGRWGTLYLQKYATVFDQPLIRDIYPVNLLTTAHLDREAGDGSVRELIRGHRAWGKMTRLADNWFMWCVPPGEIDAARDAFESRNLLKNNPSGFFRQRDGI